MHVVMRLVVCMAALAAVPGSATRASSGLFRPIETWISVDDARQAKVGGAHDLAVVSDDEDGPPVPFQFGRAKSREGVSGQHVYSHIVKTMHSDFKNASKPDITLMAPATLRRILEEGNAPRTIDFLSLDVEGHEDAALLPVLPHYTFHALVIEGPSKKLQQALTAHDYSAAIKTLGRYADQLWIHRSIPGGVQVARERARAAFAEWTAKTHSARMSHGVGAHRLRPPDTYN